MSSKTEQKQLRYFPELSGMLAALTGVPFLARAWTITFPLALFPPGLETVFASPMVLHGLAAVAACLFGASAYFISRKAVYGRLLGASGALLTTALLLPYLPHAPFAALILIIGTTAVGIRLFDVAGMGGRRIIRRADKDSIKARNAAVAALVICATGLFIPGEKFLAIAGLIMTSLAVVFPTARRVFRSSSSHVWESRLYGIGILVWLVWTLGFVFAGRSHEVVALGCLGIVALTYFVVAATRRAGRSWLHAVLEHPQRLFVSTFALLCVLGTVLLVLPLSAKGSAATSPLDAAFTAVSAVCVTGLIVLDTPNHFSFFGQAVILLLIQMGGLGMMTFSTAAFRLLGRRMSLRHEAALAGLTSSEERGRIFESASAILRITFLVEGVGALLLSAYFFAGGDHVWQALWRGLFTAISAFCNAGFALQSDSLVPYQGDPFVLHVTAVLIIAGGLSPAVVLILPRLVRKGGAPVSAQARLSLFTALGLLGLGFLMMLAMEWDNALVGLNWGDRLHNAWFQSVTLRTAGFNSVDLTVVRPATLLLMMAVMFVGGGPGGTAGGIKTTTLAILVLATLQAVRGHWTVDVFKRRIAPQSLQKAAVVTFIFIVVLLTTVTVVLLTQRLPAGVAVFESVSALATVGLSIGGTAGLDGVGKIIIIIAMFLGRVGPLSIFMLLEHERQAGLLKRPEEEIDVG